MKLLIATQNKHKKAEIEAILNPSFEVVSLSDLNDLDEVEVVLSYLVPLDSEKK